MTNSSNASTLLAQKLKEKAIQLLAKRSYSSHTLEQKLRLFYQKLALKESFEFDDECVIQAIHQVIEYCQTKHWLDDTDFLTRYIQERYRKGYGSNRIIMDSMQQGFKKQVIEEQFELLNLDFADSLQRCAQKKWGQAISTSTLEIKEKQKRYLYLLSRGFAPDLIQHYLQQK